MNKKLHINIDEVIALFDKKWEMLPDTLEHLENCQECSLLVERYSDIQTVLSSNKHIIDFPDMERINRVAEKSFAILHSENATEVKDGFILSITKLFSSFLRPAAISLTAIALVIAVYSGINTSTDKTEIAKDDSVEKNDAPLKNQENSLPGIKKSGKKINLSIASIETLKDTNFNSISENEISMGKGKAKFDVESGNDFRVTVNERFLVRVLGTSFIIDNSFGKVSVNVISGLVEVIDTSDDSSFQLSANMEKAFELKTEIVKKLEAIPIRKAMIPHEKINAQKLIITPDQSFLFQGREAVNAGNTGAAIQLFMLEIEKGKEKDKALFETVRIYEADKKYNETSSLLKNNANIINSSKVYKEELLIKGCRAQKRAGESELSLCKEYLKAFPDGYRKNEIRELINE